MRFRYGHLMLLFVFVCGLLPADAEQLVVGAVWVFVRSPCSVDSLQVQGRYLLENRINGEIEEIFSVSSQSPQEWLGDGDCQVLTGIFGVGRDVGFRGPWAHSTLPLLARTGPGVWLLLGAVAGLAQRILSATRPLILVELPT